jgi:hypothetical protein
MRDSVTAVARNIMAECLLRPLRLTDEAELHRGVETFAPSHLHPPG